MSLNTYFRPVTAGDQWSVEDVQMIASVEISQGSAVYAVGDGTHTKCTTTSANFKGILIEAIASTDSDYATSLKKKACFIPKKPQALCEFKVGAGTFTPADIGKPADFHDETSIAVDTSTHNQFVITKYLSSTRGIGYFVPNVE